MTVIGSTQNRAGSTTQTSANESGSTQNRTGRTTQASANEPARRPCSGPDAGRLKPGRGKAGGPMRSFEKRLPQQDPFFWGMNATAKCSRAGKDKYLSINSYDLVQDNHSGSRQS